LAIIVIETDYQESDGVNTTAETTPDLFIDKGEFRYEFGLEGLRKLCYVSTGLRALVWLASLMPLQPLVLIAILKSQMPGLLFTLLPIFSASLMTFPILTWFAGKMKGSLTYAPRILELVPYSRVKSARLDKQNFRVDYLRGGKKMRSLTLPVRSGLRTKVESMMIQKIDNSVVEIS